MLNGIQTIALGFTNTYLITVPEGMVMVDAGSRRKEKKFFRRLAGLGIQPHQIRLIIVTHAHYDHVGSLAAIKGKCGAKVAVHEAESEILARGRMVVPPGTNILGRLISGLGRRVNHRGWLDFPPARADIQVQGELPLTDFGLAGRLLPTPGHTPGSISLLLDSGEVFVGDAAVNFLPWGLGPIMPPFASDTERLFETWRELLRLKVTTVYPAHGSPFPADRMRRELERRTKF